MLFWLNIVLSVVSFLPYSNLQLCYSASLRIASSSRKEEVTSAVAAMLRASLMSAQMLRKKVARLRGRLRSSVTQVVRERGYTCAYLGAIVEGKPHRYVDGVAGRICFCLISDILPFHVCEPLVCQARSCCILARTRCQLRMLHR